MLFQCSKSVLYRFRERNPISIPDNQISESKKKFLYSTDLIAPKPLFEQIVSHTGSEMSTKIEGRRHGLFGLSDVGVRQPIRALKKFLGYVNDWKRHF